MTGERAFVFAKASGIIARSFVESRTVRLFPVSSIEALYALLFGRLDTSENIDDIEKRLKQREDEAVSKILKSFKHPPPLLHILAESASQDGGEPDDGAANIEYITRQNSAYYNRLWDALFALPLRDRKGITHIICEEIRLKNAAWALRMRVFYMMHPERIKPLLVNKTPPKSRRSLQYDALKALNRDIEEESDWSSWRLSKFLNKSTGERYWKLDPSYFQNAASRYLYNLARKSFRRRPFSLDTAACFIKLKQFETELLTSTAEAARLGMTGEEALTLLGLTEKGA